MVGFNFEKNIIDFFSTTLLNYNRYGEEEDFEIRYTDYDDFNKTRKDNDTLQLGINYIPLKYETEKIKLEYVPKPNLENVMERYLTGKNKDPKPTDLLQDSDGSVIQIWFFGSGKLH